MQSVVERAEHAHDRRRFFRREMKVARRIQDERRIKDRESKGGENLDEEQGRGSFGDVGQPAFPGLFFGFHSFPRQLDEGRTSILACERTMALFLTWNRPTGNSWLP